MFIYKETITVEATKRSGKPCIRHMRIAVEDVLMWLASGMSMEQILEDFPELTKSDILISLEFSAMRSQKVITAA